MQEIYPGILQGIKHPEISGVLPQILKAAEIGEHQMSALMGDVAVGHFLAGAVA